MAESRAILSGKESGWVGCSSVIEHSWTMCAALGSIPSTGKEGRERRERGKAANLGPLIHLGSAGQDKKREVPEKLEWEEKRHTALHWPSCALWVWMGDGSQLIHAENWQP